MKKFLLFLPCSKWEWFENCHRERKKKSACDVSALAQNFVGIISYLIYIRPAAKSGSWANLFFSSLVLFSQLLLLHFVVFELFRPSPRIVLLQQLEKRFSRGDLRLFCSGEKCEIVEIAYTKLLTKYKPANKYSATETVICIKSQWKCQIQCMVFGSVWEIAKKNRSRFSVRRGTSEISRTWINLGGLKLWRMKWIINSKNRTIDKTREGERKKRGTNPNIIISFGNGQIQNDYFGFTARVRHCKKCKIEKF